MTITLARSHRASGNHPGTRSVRRAVSLAGAIGLALLSALTAAKPLLADATMFRGGSGLTGAYTEKISLPLALNWKYTTNYAAYNSSSPVVVGNTIYFAGGNRVYAIDSESGALKWRYPEDKPMSTVVIASPAYSDGVVYFGSVDGKLNAVHADTGKIVWAFDTRSTISASPTIDNGVIYFGSGDGRVWAIDCKSGQSVSTWKGGVKTSDEIAGAPAVANGYVYALSLDQILHAIGQATGKERWNIRLGGSVLDKVPVVFGDYVYVANGSNLNCLRGGNGMQKWIQILTSEIVTSPAVNDQGIYFVTEDGRVHCFDPRTGRNKWKVEPKLDYDVVAPPTISGDTLFLGTLEGGVFAIDATRGAVKWNYLMQPSTNNTESITATTNVAAAPVVSNGSVLVLADDGLTSFRADAVDNTPPTISDTEPEQGIVTNGAPPIHFEAKIVDEGSGINVDTIKVMLDGNGIPKRPEGVDNDVKAGYSFDIHDGRLEYNTPVPTGASTIVPLVDGKHVVTVSASDWKGNTATKSWSFTVDNSIQYHYISKRDQQARNNPNRRGRGMRGGYGNPGAPGGGGKNRGGGRGGGG